MEVASKQLHGTLVLVPMEGSSNQLSGTLVLVPMEGGSNQLSRTLVVVPIEGGSNQLPGTLVMSRWKRFDSVRFRGQMNPWKVWLLTWSCCGLGG